MSRMPPSECGVQKGRSCPFPNSPAFPFHLTDLEHSYCLTLHFCREGLILSWGPVGVEGSIHPLKLCKMA